MIDVIGVSLDNGNSYDLYTCDNMRIKKNITVIVSTELGLEFGQVVKEVQKVPSKLGNNLGKVIRISSKADYNQYKKNVGDAKEALDLCKKLVSKLNLNMNIIDCKYTFDRSQLVFRFLSDSRIDFRDLARELASVYKTRIELRQIGARDKASEVGGCGQCGRELCCKKFLSDLDAVSISMAKNQGISLNPTKINGVCGRLMCCLKYEDECYKECRKCLPKLGSTVDSKYGTGKVISVDILNRKYKLETPNNGIVEVDCGSC